MNLQLLLLTVCQGLFLTNNVTFIAINGLVGLALAPVAWMATLPVCAYVAGGAMFAPLVARHQRALGRQRALAQHQEQPADQQIGDERAAPAAQRGGILGKQPADCRADDGRNPPDAAEQSDGAGMQARREHLPHGCVGQRR